MNIQKFSIIDNGLRGLKISHLVQEEKDGYPFMTPTKSEPKYPIHRGMENKIKELVPHFLNLCEICQNPRDEDEFTYACNDSDILEIEADNSGFKLKGIKKMTSDKSITLKTYFVEEEDGYHGFVKVQGIIQEIFAEVREYVAGNRQITTEELGQRLIENMIKKGKKGEEDLREFQEMSAEEKKAYCTKYLEDNGAISITFVEDLDLPDDSTKIVNLKQA